VSLVLIVVIFTVALLYARRQGPAVRDVATDTVRGQAEEILAEESAVVRGPSGVPLE
jgi:hypothetical protein